MALSIFGNNDAINNAMIRGLAEAFRKEFKAILMDFAEKEVDTIVKTLSERLELKMKNFDDFDGFNRHVKLEWLLKKE